MALVSGIQDDASSVELWMFAIADGGSSSSVNGALGEVIEMTSGASETTSAIIHEGPSRKLVCANAHTDAVECVNGAKRVQVEIVGD